jgi:hypothetical protein
VSPEVNKFMQASGRDESASGNASDHTSRKVCRRT